MESTINVLNSNFVLLYNLVAMVMIIVVAMVNSLVIIRQSCLWGNAIKEMTQHIA